ncbi:MAG: gliding motility-associated C-terminal domain-containing protein [Crocinitomicaceae bacterium]|nr:gliding motility-associated C-terminal domain-containing protein [Crocinitomicaceae bacterium]
MRKIAIALLSITFFTLIPFSQNSLNDFKLNEERTFIHNQGQFDGRNWQSNQIVYGYDQNPFYVFFTEKGLTYRFDKIIKNPELKKYAEDEHDHELIEEGDGHEAEIVNIPKRINISELIHATWIGSNENVEIVAEDKVDFYYSYAVRKWPTKEVDNISDIPAYQKITYKNLYDNIDVEYIIHPEGGIKYSIILHPGADPSQIQLEYKTGHTNTLNEHIDLKLNEKGQIEINTSLGNVIEHAPYTYVKGSGVSINSKYKFENNILSFDLDNYDPSQTVVIDPWVLSPNFNSSTAVWEVENDGAGNSYVIGGETPMQLRKYNAAGTQQWIYVTPWDTNSVWLGTLATDDAGNSYITSGTSPEIEKVNNAGAMQYHTNGTGLSTEYWSITFNCDKTKLIVGGTGGGLFNFKAMIYDININNGSVITSQEVGVQAGFTPVEVRSISSSKNAKYIYLTHDQVGAINQNIGACPTDAPYFELDNGHHLGYKCENYLPQTQNGGGLKALVANDQFFYTHNGKTVFQRNLINGTLVGSATIPGGNNTVSLGDIVVHCSGLAVDNCGNVYVGSKDRVVKYDANLNYISEIATTFAVYDVSVNSNGEVLAVGAESNNGSVNRVGHIASLNFGACAQYALVCCDANICPQDTLCQTDLPVNLVTTTGGGTFSGTGITNGTAGTFDPGTSGPGVFTITYTQLCGSDQINVVVDPCLTLDACLETNGSVTVTNGTPVFTWENEVTTTNCLTCSGLLCNTCGTLFSPKSNQTVTNWVQFGTGVTQTPPSYPIQITDGAGATVIITDPNNLPACTATPCDATITPAGPFCQTAAAVTLSAAQTGGTWSGTGITNASTGTFDPSVAGPGTWTITYTLTCGDTDTETITVTATDNASFTYPSGAYCLTDADPTPTITGLSGGTFTINNGGSINSSTGVIDLSASGVGSFTVTYTTNGACPTSSTFAITITNNADATITAAGPFCETDAAVNLSAATAGGTWSGTGITNTSTGTFDPATAGPGTWTITYTIAGSCGATDTENIVVNATDNASFTYPAGAYCLTDADPTPTITGLSGGTFTINNGGSINSSTGVIDLSASGVGSFTVTYTTNGSCPTSSTFAITITNSADATITAAGPFCQTDAAVNLTAATAGGTWSGTGITNASTGTFDPATAGPGTWTITYTIAGSCGATDTEDIVVNATDNASFSYAQGSYCLTDPNPTPTITGLAGGTFTINNGGTINASSGQIDIGASGAGSYTVTYTTNGPCPTSATFSVTLTTGANATITAAGPFCESDAAVTLSAVDAGGTWMGTGITNGTTGTFDPATAGPGTWTITYTISGTCGATDTEDIVVNPDDDATFNYSATSYCLTDPNPTPTITGTSGGTFTIDNGGSINASSGQIDIVASGAGTYTVTYTTGGTCPDSQTFTVTLTSGADATITAAGPFCETDAAVTLSAVDAGGTWSGTGITNGTTGTFDPATAGPGTWTITYTITGSCGDTDTEDIVVNATDDPSFSFAQGSYCLTDPNPTPSVTGLAGGTFSIDNGGSINASTGQIDIGASGAGSYTVTYTTNGPCPTSTTFAVTLTSGADATITAAGPFCDSDAALTLSAVDAGGTWSGTGITNATTGTFDPSVAGAGTWTITYTIAGTCGDTDTEDIIVNATDDATFSYSAASYCMSDPDPSATITGTSGGTFTINNGGVINSSTGAIDLDASGQGTYTVTYTTAGPCPATSTVSVTITTALDATITAAGPFCASDAAVTLSAVDAGGTWSGTGITNASTGTFDPATAGPGTWTITYTIGGACGSTNSIDITVNPVDVATFSYASTSYCLSDVNPVPTVTGTAGGTFTISAGGSINPTTGEIDLQASGAGTFTVTYTTSGACPASATATITINTAASANITPAGPFCEYNPTVTLIASTPGGIWSGNGIIDSLTGKFDPNTAGPGTHQIIYTLGGLCGGADTINISVYTAPVATVTPSLTINYGSFTVLTASGGSVYSWTPSEGLSCDDCPEPVASPEVTTTYCVSVVDSGCFDTACVTINIEYECGQLYVPNVFTPLSGDINALECVMGGACITQLSFRIYDRWGELVFETSDPDVCWDGTHMRNGKPMSTAVFVYLLDATLITGEEIHTKGNISLVR